MKLDAYLLRVAVCNRDVRQILNIFSEKFAEIALLSDCEWKLLESPWVTSNSVRMRSPIGTWGWHDGEFYEDGGIFSYERVYTILFNPNLFRQDSIE